MIFFLINFVFNKLFIYSFVEFNLSWYFSSWNLLHVGVFFVEHDACWFCSWNLVFHDIFRVARANLLHVDYFFKKLNVSLFIPLWNSLRVGFSLFETGTLVFLYVKPVLFVELVLFWFLFVKLHLFGIFRPTTCCMLVFLCETWFLFVKLVARGLFLQET